MKEGASLKGEGRGFEGWGLRRGGEATEIVPRRRPTNSHVIRIPNKTSLKTLGIDGQLDTHSITPRPRDRREDSFSQASEHQCNLVMCCTSEPAHFCPLFPAKGLRRLLTQTRLTPTFGFQRASQLKIQRWGLRVQFFFLSFGVFCVFFFFQKGEFFFWWWWGG